MKFTLASVSLALAAAVSAQSISDLPPCALNCFLGPLQNDGCSQLTDFKCHCSNKSLIPKVQPCVQQKCSPADQQKVASGVEALCAANGVTLTITTPGGSSTEAPTTSAYTTSAPITSVSVSVTTPPAYTTSRTYSYTSTNGTATLTSPTNIPTGAAAKAGFGGAVVLAAGVAALL